jgi:hypothetical protein
MDRSEMDGCSLEISRLREFGLAQKVVSWSLLLEQNVINITL